MRSSGESGSIGNSEGSHNSPCVNLGASTSALGAADKDAAGTPAAASECLIRHATVSAQPVTSSQLEDVIEMDQHAYRQRKQYVLRSILRHIQQVVPYLQGCAVTPCSARLTAVEYLHHTVRPAETGVVQAMRSGRSHGSIQACWWNLGSVFYGFLLLSVSSCSVPGSPLGCIRYSASPTTT